MPVFLTMHICAALLFPPLHVKVIKIEITNLHLISHPYYLGITRVIMLMKSMGLLVDTMPL